MRKPMLKRMVAGVCLLVASALLLSGCASDDDALTGRRDPAAAGAAEVPGAATPAPNAHSGGWW